MSTPTGRILIRHICQDSMLGIAQTAVVGRVLKWRNAYGFMLMLSGAFQNGVRVKV